MTSCSVLTTRGVHQFSLNTEDIKMTTYFYVDVVGMKLVHEWMRLTMFRKLAPNSRDPSVRLTR